MMHGLSRDTRRSLKRSMRRKRANELNIVSMIDILTVLIFFLLVNSIGVSILGVNLPADTTTPPKDPPRALSVVIRPDSLLLGDRGGAIKVFPNTTTGYDLIGLNNLLQQVKERTPDESKITLLLEPNIPYDALIQVMDAVRTARSADGKQDLDLFPAISLGDAPNAGPVAAASP
ncbi:MAG: biopolymer transporter ExbD [Nevskia sp.]|nr:biopolymer transporter ExbD [Nevskia sp.]